MKPTSGQVQAWSYLWHSYVQPPSSYIDFIAQQVTAWAADECAKICEAIANKYHENESRGFAEPTDGEIGAYNCADAIREWSKK